MSPSFNSGPSSKPTNSQTAHFNEKSPVHGPVHSPVHSPQSRFCSVPSVAVNIMGLVISVVCYLTFSVN